MLSIHPYLLYQLLQQTVQTFSVQGVRLGQQGVQVSAVPTTVGAEKFITACWFELIP